MIATSRYSSATRLRMKIEVSRNGLNSSATSSSRSIRSSDAGDQGDQQDRRGGEPEGARGRAGVERGRGPGRSGKGMPQRMATGRAVAPPAVSASRVGYSDSPDPPAGPVMTPHPRPPRAARRGMFRPVTTKPDLRRPGARHPRDVARATDVRAPARAERRRARAGASSTGRSRRTTRWASITPGAAPTRTSTSASTRCSARTSATRTASTARACGSRSTSSATSGSRTSATSRPTASTGS